MQYSKKISLNCCCAAWKHKSVISLFQALHQKKLSSSKKSISRVSRTKKGETKKMFLPLGRKKGTFPFFSYFWRFCDSRFFYWHQKHTSTPIFVFFWVYLFWKANKKPFEGRRQRIFWSAFLCFALNSRIVKNVFSFDNQKYESTRRLIHGPVNSVFLNVSRKKKTRLSVLSFLT